MNQATGMHQIGHGNIAGVPGVLSLDNRNYPVRPLLPLALTWRYGLMSLMAKSRPERRCSIESAFLRIADVAGGRVGRPELTPFRHGGCPGKPSTIRSRRSRRSRPGSDATDRHLTAKRARGSYSRPAVSGARRGRRCVWPKPTMHDLFDNNL